MQNNYYDKIVRLYDIMYSKKTGFDHKKQVAWINNWIIKKKLPKQVLDLACGTGLHLKYFKKLGYDCEGLDLSESLLNLAQKLNKNIPFKKGNFKKFKLNKKATLITSFFNSMTYNTNEKEFIKTLKNIYSNLNKNGLFIFDILCLPKPKKVFTVKEFKDKNTSFSRTFLGVPTAKGFKSTMYYVVFNGKKSEIITETTYRGSFSENKTKEILKKSGFKVLYSGKGYTNDMSVFVCQR